MREHCGTGESFQQYPKEGILRDNMNLILSKLLNKIRNERGAVYSYVLTTLKNKNDEFLQPGCGPNFEGGLITLCTCKHYMRTGRDVSDWKNDVWIAGFTGVNLMQDKRNYLFYLMKVTESFFSFKVMWESPILASARSTKNATVNPRGDMYQPMQDIKDEFAYSNYHSPIEKPKHEHWRSDRKYEYMWHKDICYKGRCGRSPALLVGDAECSFLWYLPLVCFDGKHPRTKKCDMKTFMSMLIPNEQEFPK